MFSKMYMTRLTGRLLLLAVLLAVVGEARAFSLLGPLKADTTFTGGDWQAAGFGGRPQGLGYDLAGDIGGPMLPTEAYRWNIPVITYAFDTTFLQYFGTNGVAAIESAFAILNALPPASRMSADLSEYPLDTKSENGTAASLGLIDIKSFTLSVLLEQMGLANPERFVWGLRGRDAGNNFTNYTVIQMNYDPATIAPSRYVNGVLYNYRIFDDLGPQGGEWASAVEWYQLDPLYQPYSSVAGGLGSGDFQLGSEPDDISTIGGIFGGGLSVGQFYTGLTRDDVGGLRYLLNTNNMVFDTLLPTVLPRLSGTRSSPWSPVLGAVTATNAAGVSNLVTSIGTNLTNFVRTAYRPGVDKITFQRVHVFGTNFTPITLRYTDRFINSTNGRIVKQPVERLVLQPDIIFDVRDMGTIFESPITWGRTGTLGWTNNAALQSFLGGAGLGGPGTINPSIRITFTDMVPYWFNLTSGETDLEAFQTFVWGSFDGTTRPPVAYPVFQHPLHPEFSLEYIRDVVLRRGRQ